MDLILEISAVILGFIYLFLIIRENILCWFFGIASSLLSIWLFYKTGLYSESILHIYYVIIGFYGYYLWSKKGKNNEKLHIHKMKISWYLYVILIGALLSFSLGHFFNTYTDAKSPYLDATTTVFSFIASYLEAKKLLSAWHFWIVINGVTIYLYLGRELEFYTLLTAVYFIFSFVGLYQWKKKLQLTVE